MPKAVLKFGNNEPTELALAFPQGKITPSNFGADQVMYTLEHPSEHIAFLDLAASQKINMLEPARGERFFVCKRKGADRNSAVRWDVWLSPEAEKARAAREAGVDVKANGRPAWGGNPPPPTYEELARPAAPGPTLLERQLAESLATVERLKAAHAEAERLKKAERDAGAAPTAPVQAAKGERPASTNITATAGHNGSANGNAAPAPSIHQGWYQLLLQQTNALTDVFAAALQHSHDHGDAVDPEHVKCFLVTAFINQRKTQ